MDCMSDRDEAPWRLLYVTDAVEGGVCDYVHQRAAENVPQANCNWIRTPFRMRKRPSEAILKRHSLVTIGGISRNGFFQQPAKEPEEPGIDDL